MAITEAMALGWLHEAERLQKENAELRARCERLARVVKYSKEYLDVPTLWLRQAFFLLQPGDLDEAAPEVAAQ